MPYKDATVRREKHSEYMKTYLQNPVHKRKHVARIQRNRAAHKIAVAALLADFRKFGCDLCGEKEHCCLSAHHVGKKDFALARAFTLGYSITRIKAELAKCMCVCENCHRKVHAGKISIQ